MIQLQTQKLLFVSNMLRTEQKITSLVSFIYYVRKIFRKTNISYPLIRIHTSTEALQKRFWSAFSRIRSE